MGPSGCGKSTLFSWMIGALAGQFSVQVSYGSMSNGLTCYPPHSVRLAFFSRMHCYLTSSASAKFTAGATVLTLKGTARRNAVKDALDRAGLAETYHQDPATLSGGQRARVALLRALLAQPKALLLDGYSAVLMWLCAIIFASGCSAKFANWRSPLFR
ncbi:ATP-binding cassette domain-containing protein [Escherichia coli]